MKIITADKIRFNDSTEISSATNSGLNYILNPGAEVDVSGAFVYADAAGTIPVDGTGGSPTVTITRTTSAPQRGIASYLFTKDATNRQGEGFSIPFSIHSADKASMLQIGADIIVGSGTFNAGSSTTDSDVTLWVYDVTNSRLIQPTNYRIFSNSSTLSFPFSGTFQASSDSTSYRLIFHVGTTNASAWTLKIDNIVVGPLLKTVTSAIGDWQSYTPTFGAGFGTPTSVSFYWRRVGGSIQIKGSFTNGTSTAAESSISLPSGISMDTAKLVSLQTRLGTANRQVISSGGLTNTMYACAYYSTFGANKFLVTYSASAGTMVNVNVNDYLSTSDGCSIEFEAPVAGWGSNVELNTMDSNRPVHAIYNNLVYANSSPSTPLQYSNKVLDTHNAVTTGSGWKFTAPVAGVYSIHGSSLNETGGYVIATNLYVNGTQVQLGSHSSAGNFYSNYKFEYQLKAGDYLDVRFSVSDATVISTGFFIAISKLDSATQIGANETVAASYYSSSNAAISASVQINFDTLIDDTHNAVTVGAGAWKFTAPISGLYQVGGRHNSNSGTGFYIQLYKNNSLHMGHVGYVDNDGVTTYSAQIRLIAGDYIDLRGSSGSTIGGGALSSGPSRIEIRRIN